MEVAKEANTRIERLNDKLNAFLTPTPELALDQALRAERLYRDGGETPALLGVPVAIKDLFHVSGVRTTFGSLVYKDYISTHDSGAVRRLRGAGAVFVGKTNTAEFGQSATTENRLGDACRNPWDALRTAGGSSGGSAAAVAAGLAVAGLGSDGGGSIRIPAAFCGLVGFKPTIGLCNDEGGFQTMTAVCCPGPITRTVADARIMLSVLASSPFKGEDVRPRLRIAWCPRPEGRPVDQEMLSALQVALDALVELGHTVVGQELALDGWRDVFGTLVQADERRLRSHLLQTHPHMLTEYERRTLEVARRRTPEEIANSYELLADYRQRISLLFNRFDIIATPTTAVPAFPVASRPRTIDGQHVDRLWGAFPFCVPFNVAGCPAITIPVGLIGGMPVGLQLVAPVAGDARLIDLGEDLEEVLRSRGLALFERAASGDGELMLA